MNVKLKQKVLRGCKVETLNPSVFIGVNKKARIKEILNFELFILKCAKIRKDQLSTIW